MICVGEVGVVGVLLCAVDEPGDDVGLDGQHLGRGQCSDVFGHVVALQKRPTGAQHSARKVLGQVDPDRGVGHQAGAGDPLLDLAPDVGSVLRRPSGPQAGEHDVDRLLAIHGPHPPSAGHDR
jgi:hypothetical protein